MKGSNCSCSGGFQESTGFPNYLEVNVLRFVHLLRSGGVKIGSAEVVDALYALEKVPLLNKKAVQVALRATLIKKSADLAFFDKSFEEFFASPEYRSRQEKEYRSKQEDLLQKKKEAEQVFTFRNEDLNLTDSEKIVYASLPEREKKRMQDFMEMTEGRETLNESFKPFLETMVKGRLSFWYKQQGKELEEKMPRPSSGDQEMDAIRDAVEAGLGGGGKKLLHEDMQNIAREDLPRAMELIRRMARLLVTRISRRYRRSKRRRKLDIRRTIRDNLQYGGALFKLRYKSARLQKPRLLLVCDVSGSMIRYTSFVLQFIYGLNSVVHHIESFVFSDNLERITPYFQKGKSFEMTMSELVKNSSSWGGGTCLHKALGDLSGRHADELQKNTIVIMVSDTKTVRHQDALQELSALKDKVREIIWLNTLPYEEWDNSATVKAFSKIVAMYPCNTLGDLQKVLHTKLAG